MTPLESINAEIATLQKQHDEVVGTETEVYSRIVGYYRSSKNWNTGKAEEFEERKVYDVEKSLERRNV